MPHKEAANTKSTKPKLSFIGAKQDKDLFYDTLINDKETVIYVDPGATDNFISRTAAENFQLTIREVCTEVELGDKSCVQGTGITSTSVTLSDIN